ncbi:MAG: xylan 1,4-beta-xylosidase [Lachnospiraceae bacterium]|nr:xylan 1,4-beta-xylosidase [Lachnospiraceae bacterium]
MGNYNRFEVVFKEDHALTKGLKMVLVDKETGVNYLFVQSGYAGGLTPLLDADGKPVITR